MTNDERTTLTYGASNGGTTGVKVVAALYYHLSFSVNLKFLKIVNIILHFVISHLGQPKHQNEQSAYWL